MTTQNNSNKLSILIAVATLLVIGLALWLMGPWSSPATAAGLTGKTWRLIAINGKPTVAGSNATLQFEKDSLGGNSGVNSFGGKYQMSGNSITTSDLVSTLMASADPALNQQEADYLNVLRGPLTYTITGNQLELSSAAGTLTFEV